MHEPITIARLRKATTIKVPAGGWIVLVGPDKSFTEHAGARAKLAESATHAEMSEVICGRIDNKYRNLRFLTTAEIAANAQEVVAADKAVAQSIAEGKTLAEKKNASDLEKSQSAHKEQIARINKENAAIANREFPGASHAEIPVATGTDLLEEDHPNEFKVKAEAELNKTTLDELRSVVAGLNKGLPITNTAAGFTITSRQQFQRFHDTTTDKMLIEAILARCDFTAAQPI